MKNLGVKILMALMLGGISMVMAQKSPYTNGNNKTFHNPTPGEVTILAITPIPENMEPTRELLEGVSDCGFNLASTSGSVSFFKKMFGLMDGLKLKFLISNQRFGLLDYRKTYIDAFKNNPYVSGWILSDEPAYDTLETLKEQYDAFYKEDPTHLVYINLVGIVYKKFTGPFSSYSGYLNHIQNLFAPALWSYDYYPITVRSGKLDVDYNQFYSSLEDMSSIAKKTSRPFWGFCESMAYKTSSYSRPAPTEAYLRFEAFSALAYGAQGIVYWAYSLRKAYGGETYQSALVDLEGKKSKAWYAAQKVNQEIKKFNDVFYQSEVKGVWHLGDNLYKGTKRLSGPVGPVKMIRAGKAGVVVSQIENHGKNYIVIVSRDVLKNQKINIELNPNRNVVNLTGKNLEQYSWRKDITLTLEKGGYIILEEYN